MTFRVNSAALRHYAATLRECYSDVADAKTYLHVHGNFSFHESGIIGTLAGQHTSFMSELEKLHNQLLLISLRSAEALTDAAGDYDDTDQRTAARVDASYPTSPRSAPSRD